MQNISTTKAEIKKFVLSLGFEKVGISTANNPVESSYLAKWLEKGFHGDMNYLSKEPQNRESAKTRHPWAKSVICALKNYHTNQEQENGVIAQYALYRDYHLDLKERLWKVCDYIEKNFNGKAIPCVDTSPILERPYAKAAGLGWIGKNSLLLNKSMGSFFFLGEVITDLELEPDEPYKRNYCGKCTKCIDICPTRAIVSPYVIDSNKCISYLTIEYRGIIPRELRPLMGNLIFGCDICQEVCPWNKFAKESYDMKIVVDTKKPLDEYMCISDAEFNRMFKNTAIKRAKRDGFLRNVAIALGNTKSKTKIPALIRGLNDHSWLVRLHSAWALYNITAETLSILQQRLAIETNDKVREEIIAVNDQHSEICTRH